MVNFLCVIKLENTLLDLGLLLTIIIELLMVNYLYLTKDMEEVTNFQLGKNVAIMSN